MLICESGLISIALDNAVLRGRKVTKMHDCTIYNVILVGDNIIAKQTASSRLKFIHDTSVIDINTMTE